MMFIQRRTSDVCRLNVASAEDTPMPLIHSYIYIFCDLIDKRTERAWLGLPVAVPRFISFASLGE